MAQLRHWGNSSTKFACEPFGGIQPCAIAPAPTFRYECRTRRLPDRNCVRAPLVVPDGCNIGQPVAIEVARYPLDGVVPSTVPQRPLDGLFKMCALGEIYADGSPIIVIPGYRHVGKSVPVEVTNEPLRRLNPCSFANGPLFGRDCCAYGASQSQRVHPAVVPDRHRVGPTVAVKITRKPPHRVTPFLVCYRLLPPDVGFKCGTSRGITCKRYQAGVVPGCNDIVRLPASRFTARTVRCTQSVEAHFVVRGCKDHFAM